MKQDLSDSSSSDSDSSHGSDYKSKIRNKKKIYRKTKKEPIKLCAKLTEKLLMTAYKLKIIKFKFDEDPLQHRIYFLTLIESLEMIFSKYKETCEVLLYYPKIGGYEMKYFFKKSIRNLLHANIDVHNRRLVSEFPRDEVKFISKLQSHCANMTFSNKSSYDRFSRKLKLNEGRQQ